MSAVDSHVQVRIAALRIYPVKSCAGIALDASPLAGTGFAFDRNWMVVDASGRFVTQRELPRMVLIRPTLTAAGLVLTAPGMPALAVPFDATGPLRRVTVWRDEVTALDMGEPAAQWFSNFLDRSLRLVRFAPQQRRLSDRAWTRGIQAETAFADGYPLLITSLAALDELNRRLVAAGEGSVTMARFRPNIVLDGLDAHGEDHLDELGFATPGGMVRLKFAKPCARCPIPDTDLATAERGHAVRDALASYRADARVGGAVTFGMNAVIVEGTGLVLSAGLAGSGGYRFDD